MHHTTIVWKYSARLPNLVKNSEGVHVKRKLEILIMH